MILLTLLTVRRFPPGAENQAGRRFPAFLVLARCRIAAIQEVSADPAEILLVFVLAGEMELRILAAD